MAEQGVSFSFACLYGNLEPWVSDIALSCVEGEERCTFVHLRFILSVYVCDFAFVLFFSSPRQATMGM